ncbi:hypothetical protein [Enterococcus faecalis]|uniref:hypothetical protein n=1 Tax=Enterococcus faecalis TaxID=1351 RepID=UPI0018916123|nr:hypothetical protein [Enterococcus faecalis]QPB60528.1 hypothetical protein GFB65_10830 [Enterococcus faecalis]
MDNVKDRVRKAQRELMEVTKQLAKELLDDSETYEEARKKLKDVRWNLIGSYSEELIETVDSIIEKQAMKEKISVGR